MDPVSNACDELFERHSPPGSSSGRFLVACSGGMDSTVLLHAVVRSASRRDALERVVALHIDHGLDPDSGRWRAHCAALADEFGIALEARALQLSPGSNLEARARAARYAVFESLLAESDVLLLAHHENDQLESQLLHLFQGRGLYGMPQRRALGAGYLERPLLALPRSALAGYAGREGLNWIEDPSNADERLDRNYLRRRLLPALSGRFQGLAQRIGRVAGHLTDTAAAMDELAGLDRVPLPLAVFDGLSQPARLALLRRWLTRHAGSGGVSRAALTEFLHQLDAGNDRQPSLDLVDGRLVRFQRALHIAPEPPELAASYPLGLPGTLRLPHGTLTVSVRSGSGAGPAGCGPVGILVLPPLSVSFAGEGDRLRSGGHDRAVRDLMREAGIPPWQRETLPLLTDTLGIAAIPGVAVRDEVVGNREPVSINVAWKTEVR